MESLGWKWADTNLWRLFLLPVDGEDDGREFEAAETCTNPLAYPKLQHWMN